MPVKILRRLVPILFSAAFLYGALAFPSELSDAVRSALSMCAQSVIPSLFPFLILSSIVTDTGVAVYFGKALGRIMRPLFGVNGASASALVLGWVGGYPIGAACAANLYEKKMCTKSEAEHLLTFCNNCGPGFIIGAVGIGVFGDTCTGVLLYTIHIAASVLCGVISRIFHRSEPSGIEASCSVVCSLPTAFTRAVKSAAVSCINISAFVVCFGVVIRLLECFGTLAALSSFLRTVFALPENLSAKLLGGVLEMTNGLMGISQCSGGRRLHIIAAAAISGWGGISVHFQTVTFIEKSGLSAKCYIVGKAVHAVLSAAIAHAILAVDAIGNTVLTFSPTIAENIASPTANSALYTLAAGTVLLMLVFFAIIFYELWQNDWKSSQK